MLQSTIKERTFQPERTLEKVRLLSKHGEHVLSSHKALCLVCLFRDCQTKTERNVTFGSHVSNANLSTLSHTRGRISGTISTGLMPRSPDSGSLADRTFNQATFTLIRFLLENVFLLIRFHTKTIENAGENGVFCKRLVLRTEEGTAVAKRS